jgi:ABC-type transporter Mla maintaining outer membrane lipid asymmetry ATPase subunit MlaF
MLKLISVTKSFLGRPILENINLVVQEELIAIVGATGSGKTVLLKIIAGLIKPDKGEIIIPNNVKLGYVFQHAALFDSLTVEANITLPLIENTSISKKEIKLHLERIRNILGLSDSLLRRKCYHLSGGEQKLVALARVLISDPHYVLYDEPTSGLDPNASEKICEVIKVLKKPGILVTHDFRVIETIEIKERYLLENRVLVKLTN